MDDNCHVENPLLTLANRFHFLPSHFPILLNRNCSNYDSTIESNDDASPSFHMPELLQTSYRASVPKTLCEEFLLSRTTSQFTEQIADNDTVNAMVSDYLIHQKSSTNQQLLRSSIPALGCGNFAPQLPITPIDWFVPHMQSLRKTDYGVRENQLAADGSNEDKQFMEFMQELAEVTNTSSGDNDIEDVGHWDGSLNWESTAAAPGITERTVSSDSKQRQITIVENPYSDVTDTYEIGLSLLREGRISEAIAAFEANIHSDLNTHSCWKELAICYAENDQDEASYHACVKVLKVDQHSLNTLISLMRLFTNRMFAGLAANAINAWLALNPTFQTLFSASQRRQHTQTLLAKLTTHSELGVYSVEDAFPEPELLSDVEGSLLAAARITGEVVDAQLQTVMGIFYHLIGNYDRAIDCFRSALAVDMDNAFLWNKLGATLAKANQDASAVWAYKSALQQAPGYVRARANLAITCLSLGANREALEHTVDALTLQNRSMKGKSAKRLGCRLGDAALWTCADVATRRLHDDNLMELVAVGDLEALARSLSS